MLINLRNNLPYYQTPLVSTDPLNDETNVLLEIL